MIYFSDRLALAKLYDKWVDDEKISRCPETVISFLQISGLLNEEKAETFLDEYESKPKRVDNGEASAGAAMLREDY